MRKIEKLIVHHSESPGGGVEFLRHVHMHDNGWRDVGYHYIICNGKMHGKWPGGIDGLVQTGRPEFETGAHAKNHNANTIGICLIGDFTEDKPTKKQIQSLTSLLMNLCMKYDLNPFDAIYGHRDVNETTCPGRFLYSMILPIRIFLGTVFWDGK